MSIFTVLFKKLSRRMNKWNNPILLEKCVVTVHFVFKNWHRRKCEWNVSVTIHLYCNTHVIVPVFLSKYGWRYLHIALCSIILRAGLSNDLSSSSNALSPRHRNYSCEFILKSLIIGCKNFNIENINCLQD